MPGRIEALVLGIAFTGVDAGAAERLLAAPGGLAVVAVRVGAHEVEMLVDTGSTATLLDPALARALELPSMDRVLLTTPTGTRPVPRAVLPALEVDGQLVENLRVLVTELPGLAGTGRPLRGIIGLDALSRFDLALDFHSRELALGVGCPVGRPDGLARVRFEDRNGVVLETHTRPDQPPWRLLLDSGASGLVLFGAAATDAGRVDAGGTPDWRLTAADGARPAAGARVARLLVGDLTLEDVPAALLDEASARGVGGPVPASLFSRICLSRSGGYVLLEAPPGAGVAPDRIGG